MLKGDDGVGDWGKDVPLGVLSDLKMLMEDEEEGGEEIGERELEVLVRCIDAL